MKTLKKVLFPILLVLFAASSFAQAPQKMSYQAVVRDTSNSLVTNSAIGIRASIIQGSASGSNYYVETHTDTSNSNGMISIELGNGTATTGVFDTISWNNGPFFLKIEIDPTGGSTYSISGTSELLSVPYALYANTADSLVGGINYTETDPVFDASLAKQITSGDTTRWGNHTVDTQLDSTGIAAFGYVAGAHTIDTQLDSSGIAAFGYVSGAHTDSSDVSGFGYVAGAHTIDTKLDSSGIAAFGYVAGAHTDSTDVSAFGYVAGAHTIDTKLDSSGIAAFGFVAGAHTDSSDVANYGFVAGAHTDSSDIAALGFVAQLTYTIGFNQDLGGYIFYVTPNGKHGLVVAMLDQSASYSWYASDDVLNDPANHDANGKEFTDWRLPTKRELNLLYSERGTIGGFSNERYWASSSYDFNDAWNQNFSDGIQDYSHKDYTYRVRCVRSF